jgi:hypothetical protein
MAIRTSLAAAALAAVALVPASASAQKVAPDIKDLKVTPVAFKALATGGPVVLSGGALVSYEIADSVDVRFTVKQEKTGKRSGGKCVAGKPKSKPATCTRTVDVPGGFTIVGIPGMNEFRFSGRISDKKLAPGRYRLVGKSAEGTAARSSYTRFKIVK